MYSKDAEIICASIGNTTHIIECAKIGASTATIPYKLIKQMMKHPLTDEGIESFKRIIKIMKILNYKVFSFL